MFSYSCRPIITSAVQTYRGITVSRSYELRYRKFMPHYNSRSDGPTARVDGRLASVQRNSGQGATFSPY